METTPENILVTTAFNFEGYKIISYLGLVAGSNYFKLKDKGTDTWRRTQDELLAESKLLGGNAVIGVITTADGVGPQAALGTAVKVVPV